jgi:hypothetical protein
MLDPARAPETSQEILAQLRLLQSTVQVKLNQFDRTPLRGVLTVPSFR